VAAAATPSTGTIDVTLKTDTLAKDTLTSIERIQFDERSVAYDIDGVAGKAYRLYQAAFDRAPDEAGIGYWIAHMDKRMSLHDVAAYFVDSPEFNGLFGAAPSDAAFKAWLRDRLHSVPVRFFRRRNRHFHPYAKKLFAYRHASRAPVIRQQSTAARWSEARTTEFDLLPIPSN
jgi:hypothetical protein